MEVINRFIAYELLRIRPSSCWSGTRTMKEKRHTHKSVDGKHQERKKKHSRDLGRDDSINQN